MGRTCTSPNTDGLRIVSVADAEVVAEPELPQGSHQLLLDGTRLVVVTSSWSGSPDTIVSSYDVADPTSPSLLRRTHLEGNVVATRSVDGVARLVISTTFDQRLPFVQPNQFGLDEKSALERNKQIIADSSIEDWLPREFDEAGDGGFGPMSAVLDCENVAAPGEFAGLGLTWIASIDVQNDATPVGSAGIVSTGDTVYASTDNLYIATQNWDWQWGGPVPVPMEGEAATVEPSTGALGAPELATPASDPTIAPQTTEVTETTAVTESTRAPVAIDDTVTPDTTEVAPSTTEPDDLQGPPPTLIHQFRLDEGTGRDTIASGEVEGRLLNQFAMSEYNGDLRVATTTDNWGNFSGSERVDRLRVAPERDRPRTALVDLRARQGRTDPGRSFH